MNTPNRKLFVCLLIILVLCFAGCTKNDEKNALAYIKSARNFLAQNKPETAVIEYRNAIKLDPKNALAYFELAETYIRLMKVNQAIKYYNLAIQANPQYIPPHLRLTQIYLKKDQLLDAREFISKVLDISPVSIEAYHLLSGIQIKERDFESAIETLNKAASIDSKNIKTHVSLAQLYIKIKSIDQAEKAYRIAIVQDPSSRQAYMGLVKLYAVQKKWDQIEALLIGLLDTDGIKVEKYTDLARFYEGQKKYKPAEENYQKAAMQNPEDAVPLINLAEFYTKRNMADKAILTMKNALAKQSKNPLIHTGLSQIYLQFKMVEEAEKSVDNALGIDKNYVDALFQKGRVLMYKKDYKQALDKFDQVIGADKINAKAYYYRALCIKERGATDRPGQKIYRAAAGLLDNPEEFEKDQIKANFLAAITVDPKLTDARLKLTEIYILEKDIKRAKEQIEEIFKWTAPNIKIMTLLVGVNLLEGNLKEAEEILRVIIREKPDYTPAYIRLGFLYESTDRKEQAIAILQQAFERDPNQLKIVNIIIGVYISDKKYNSALALVETFHSKASPDTYSFFENLKGEIYLKLNDIDRAFIHFETAQKLKPDFIPPHMHMANIFSKRNYPDKALESYQRVEKIDPGYVPALIAMGTVFNIQGNLIQAEAYYLKVLDRQPDHPGAANNLAFILSEKKGTIDEAFKYARIAREKAPKDPNVLDTIGWIYYQKGNYLNALSELEESLRLNPQSALASYHYGMTLYRTQEYEKARTYFNRALEIDPKFKDAKIVKKMLN